MPRKPRRKIVGLEEMATNSGFSRMQIRNFVFDGVLTPVARGQYDLIECLKKLIEYYRNKADADSKSVSARYAEARLRLRQARANIAERKDLVHAGKYVPIEGFQIVFDAMITELREGIESCPALQDEQKEAVAQIVRGLKLDNLPSD